MILAFGIRICDHICENQTFFNFHLYPSVCLGRVSTLYVKHFWSNTGKIYLYWKINYRHLLKSCNFLMQCYTDWKLYTCACHELRNGLLGKLLQVFHWTSTWLDVSSQPLEGIKKKRIYNWFTKNCVKLYVFTVLHHYGDKIFALIKIKVLL